MIQAMFERKPDFRLREVEISKVIRLPTEEYEHFLKHPCADYKFIEEHSNLIFMDDKSGAFHCILVTGEGRRDGVLVEAEGYSYARYASYVPEATALFYDALSKSNETLAKVAEQIVEEGVAEDPGAVSNVQRLRDILCARWENVHLMHSEIENEPHTIVELSENTLTEAGKEAWTDVLNAKVERVYQGFYGLQIELSGVSSCRLDSFSAMLGGYCSVQEYEAWVNEPKDETASLQINNI